MGIYYYYYVFRGFIVKSWKSQNVPTGIPKEWIKRVGYSLVICIPKTWNPTYKVCHFNYFLKKNDIISLNTITDISSDNFDVSNKDEDKLVFIRKKFDDSTKIGNYVIIVQFSTWNLDSDDHIIEIIKIIKKKIDENKKPKIE